MRLRVSPKDPKFDYFRFMPITFGISMLGIIASIVLVLTVGLNLGVDFRGGTMITTETPEAVEISRYRDVLGGLGLGDVSVTQISDPAAELTGVAQNSALIRIEEQSADPAIQSEAIARVQAALSQAVPDIQFLAVESVGAKVSGELLRSGVLAVLLSLGAVMVYVWLRFEWQFAVGAVAALIHDVILTFGVFTVVRMEFNLAVIAAVLTIIGYSLNDTVVIFDRVRENLKKFKTMPLRDVLNLSINETLSRTLMTALTTLIALVALYIFGGEVIRGFTFAMIWGVVVGTYSTVFVASVILLRLGVKRDWSNNPGGSAGTQFANIDA